MDSLEIPTGRPPLRVRPGLLLALLVVAFFAILNFTRHGYFLATSSPPVKWAVFVFAAVAVCLGWYFTYVERKSGWSVRMWVALVGAIALTLSMPAYILFAAVPYKYILGSSLLSAIAPPLYRWQEMLAAIGLLAPFLGRSRSRVAFALAGTLMIALWN
jgi:hypothetical protein